MPPVLGEDQRSSKCMVNLRDVPFFFVHWFYFGNIMTPVFWGRDWEDETSGILKAREQRTTRPTPCFACFFLK